MDNPILKFTNIEDRWFDGYTTSWLGYTDGTNQTDYLQFAEDDLNDGHTQRHLINAVSNAKRALHMEVETLSTAYGVNESNKKFCSFPQRLAFLSRAGLFAKPRLLAKLNKLRNVVEHEYHVPTLEEAENFVDIVDLFINAMQRHRHRYPCEIDMHEAIDDGDEWQIWGTTCDLKNGELKLLVFPKGTSYARAKGKNVFIRFSEDSDLYLQWLSHIVRANT